MNNQLTTVNELKQLVQSDYVKERFNDVLGKKSQAFIASMLSVVSNNELLSKADPKSVLNAAMTAATLDLPINQNLGFAYIIPYNDRKTGQVVAQFQMGYKGFIQLSQRSGQFKTINVTDVREGEIQGIDRLTGEITFSWSQERDRLAIIGYVGYIKLINGFEKTLYLTTEELKKHGLKYSQTAKKGYGLWNDDFDAMAKKTVIKLLLSKYAPLTTQMQTAQLADQAVVKEDGYVYPDNEKETPEEIAEQKETEKIRKHIENSKTAEELRQCEEYIYDAGLKDLYDAKMIDFMAEDAEKEKSNAK